MVAVWYPDIDYIGTEDDEFAKYNAFLEEHNMYMIDDTSFSEYLYNVHSIYGNYADVHLNEIETYLYNYNEFKGFRKEIFELTYRTHLNKIKEFNQRRLKKIM